MLKPAIFKSSQVKSSQGLTNFGQVKSQVKSQAHKFVQVKPQVKSQVHRFVQVKSQVKSQAHTFGLVLELLFGQGERSARYLLRIHVG